MTQRYRSSPYPRALLDAEDRLRARPVLLELVVVALRGREHVHDDGPEVHEDPVRFRGPLAADRLDALVAKRLEDAVGDRADLPLRPAGADDEGVSQGRELAQVEEHDVGGLLVLRE